MNLFQKKHTSLLIQIISFII